MPTSSTETGLLLTLLQVSDSGFPTGGFAHSGGVEALLRDGVTPADVLTLFEVWVRESLGPKELAFVSRAWALEGAPDDTVVQLGTLRRATRPTQALREADRARGRAFRRLASSMWPEVEGRIEGCPDNYPVMFGLAMSVLGVGHQPTLTAYAFQLVNEMALATVKLGVMGPSRAQLLVVDLAAAVGEVVSSTTPESALDGFAPAWEVASCRHTTLSARLFHT